MNKNTLKTRRWANKHKHPCLDCGKPVYYRSQRCKSCACILWNRQRAKPAVLHLCSDCSTPITPRASYCRSCSSKHRPKKYSQKGRVKTSHGYIVVYLPPHPRANTQGYVYEHILVWEEFHGKPLPKGWIVHHLNGIRSDNRPRNLEGMPSMKHNLVLVAKAKRIQELEALLNNQGQLF